MNVASPLYWNNDTSPAPPPPPLPLVANEIVSSTTLRADTPLVASPFTLMPLDAKPVKLERSTVSRVEVRRRIGANAFAGDQCVVDAVEDDVAETDVVGRVGRGDLRRAGPFAAVVQVTQCSAGAFAVERDGLVDRDVVRVSAAGDIDGAAGIDYVVRLPGFDLPCRSVRPRDDLDGQRDCPGSRRCPSRASSRRSCPCRCSSSGVMSKLADAGPAMSGWPPGGVAVPPYATGICAA